MKKNLPLYIGIALPIIFILIIAFIVYLPRTFTNPQNNFIYTINDYENYSNEVVMVDGEVVVRPVSSEYPVPEKYYTKDTPEIYIYDFEKNASYELTLTEAQEYSLVKGPSSPEGYSVVNEYSHNGIFEIFGSNNSNSGKALVSPNGTKRTLTGLKGDNYQEINIVGWVK